jgi:superfamily II DNA helicase RecQ
LFRTLENYFPSTSDKIQPISSQSSSTTPTTPELDLSSQKESSNSSTTSNLPLLPSKQNTIRTVLQDVWGSTTFRPHQKEVVQALLQGRDALVVMPTGQGKSLCFQLPAICLPGLSIVCHLF